MLVAPLQLFSMDGFIDSKVRSISLASLAQTSTTLMKLAFKEVQSNVRV